MRATLMTACAAALLLSGPIGSGTAAEKERKTEPPPTVFISPTAGFFVKPCAGAGCTEGKRRVPKKNGYDYTGLRKVLTKLRKRYTKAPALYLAPSPKTPWGVVAKTLATARRTAAGNPLFPVVYLTVVDSQEERDGS